MTSTLTRAALVLATLLGSACTIDLGGAVEKDGGGGGGGNGGGGAGDDDSSDGGGGSGGDSGGDSGGSGGSGGGDAYIDGFFTIDIVGLCDIVWDMSGPEASCSGCDLAFDVDLTNNVGSCTGVGNTEGALVFGNGAAYFDGNYIGEGAFGGGIAAFYSYGYIYGEYGYQYIYYGGGYY